MAIDVLCRFIGGPQGDVTLTLHQYHCVDRISLEVHWLKPLPSGSVAVVDGQRPRNVDWLSSARAVYEKSGPVTKGEATYQFTEVVEVRRCARILEGKGRQCRHEAAADSDLCVTHRAKSA